MTEIVIHLGKLLADRLPPPPAPLKRTVFFLLRKLWSLITPVNPFTTILPLVFIFGISAFKEIVDDTFRHLSDRKLNMKKVDAVIEGRRRRITSKDVRCGDLIYVKNEEEIPCDIVVLASSNEEGNCFIQTANLDGETDLKPRRAIEETAKMTEEEIYNFKGVIECDHPNPRIYDFKARIRMHADAEENEIHTLSTEQTLLQATRLANTDWVVGTAVYTGNETKLGKNKRKTPSKYTKVEKLMNKHAIFQFCLQWVFVFAFGIIGDMMKFFTDGNTKYLNQTDETMIWPIVYPLRFMLLMSYFIPISLKVTIDVVKYYLALVIRWDLDMYDYDSGVGAKAQNTSTSEELGQIDYVFTDKTGTLTENIMALKHVALSRVFDIPDGDVLAKHIEGFSEEEFGGHFLKCLALNHTVIPEVNKLGERMLKASSPDELALVGTAARLGYKLEERDLYNISIMVNDPKVEDGEDAIEHAYKILTMLHFDPVRKRMSVIIQEKGEEGKILLYTKGADDVILARLDQGEVGSEYLKTCEVELEKFAVRGLRTLVVAGREIPKSEFDEWYPKFEAATKSMENREEDLHAAYELIERDLILYGVTAIEDKLQDGVPETVAQLRKAGIVFWMLTGDKFSTAVQISKACRLMSDDGVLLPIEGQEMEEVVESIEKAEEIVNAEGAEKREFTSIITGKSLAVVLEDRELEKRFLDLAIKSATLICCRVTPKQKGAIVASVKKRKRMTLAIGDGGNDVVMIQQAHIGVGIVGKEGLQAAAASDYSFGRFRFLSRLLLIHGRYSYHRLSFIIQYSFYKSTYLALFQLLYNIFASFSGVSFWHSIPLTLFNITYTSLTVFVYALDKDVSEETALGVPKVYLDGRKRRLYNHKTFFFWMLKAYYQAIVALGLSLVIFGSSNFMQLGFVGAQAGDLMFTSSMAYTVVIYVQTCMMYMHSYSLTMLHHEAILGSFVIYLFFQTLFSVVLSTDLKFVWFYLLVNPVFWLSTILITVVSIYPLLLIEGVKNWIWPSSRNYMRQLDKVARQKKGVLFQEDDGTITLRKRKEKMVEATALGLIIEWSVLIFEFFAESKWKPVFDRLVEIIMNHTKGETWKQHGVDFYNYLRDFLVESIWNEYFFWINRLINKFASSSDNEGQISPENPKSPVLSGMDAESESEKDIEMQESPKDPEELLLDKEEDESSNQGGNDSTTESISVVDTASEPSEGSRNNDNITDSEEENDRIAVKAPSFRVTEDTETIQQWDSVPIGDISLMDSVRSESLGPYERGI